MLQNSVDYQLLRSPLTLTERISIQPLDSVNPDAYPDAVNDYFAHYGLTAPEGLDIEHLFGYFVSDGIKLAAHLYHPQTYRATVLLLHGYLNHSAQFQHLIRHLLQNGYAVAVFDLPGHGLSGGNPAEIESFEQYVHAVQDFLVEVMVRLQGPHDAVGFSTGAAVLIDMLLTNRADDIAKVVLAAPLIHWTLYEQSKNTYRVYSTFTDRIARFHRKNSSDRDYLVFNKTQDYLHCKYLSLKWVKALFEWNDRLPALSPSEANVLVIQGDRDGTVDWNYNLDVIREKFPQAAVQMIAGANHELFNESSELRAQALQNITSFFNR
jgi:alpha-beta hydrolase superfamily lysophospholipase